ncbi:DEAD/DEAH box helicase [Oceanicella actignis]|uniref:DEAD-box ATP-dependent RNA helicase RhpA n=1 Tax=Oceanicella actignis TaxID=1189325 RepID=A0A1M7TUI0_9RHOB|nr:DEAD/DEAH box helicase [Oceanicella actignis]SES78785.1 ATP-dependent RNA helicase RhlE [Oceanicella actignis]SHN74409.1 ATP-dependent RNA helicase RhlE [Oceanicella actignis]
MTNVKFAELGLAEPLLRALAARGHEEATPIQAQAIPALLEGRDMLGIAQTGTGKTGAFALPILHRLSGARGGSRREPRALILAPTRELAIQIGEEMQAYGKFAGLRHTVIFGGVKHGPQFRALSRGVDVVIATPGRLLDHLDQGSLSLRAVEVLVLDEADRMLDMGFVRDVRRILKALPAQRQSLLFSATMPREVAGLSAEILHDPIRVEIAPQSTTVERIAQSVRHVNPGMNKRQLLEETLADPEMTRVILFTRTKHRANKVAEDLARAGIEADAIHGGKSQNARQRALARFKSGRARVLVATDIAARGIDVDAVSHVVNYELPNEPESYVHRIGRTARAGAAGSAISFCDPSERGYLRDIERVIQMRLDVIGDGPEGRDEKPAPRGGLGRGRPAQGPRGGAPKKAGGRPAAGKPAFGKPAFAKPGGRRPRRGGAGRPAQATA